MFILQNIQVEFSRLVMTCCDKTNCHFIFFLILNFNLILTYYDFIYCADYLLMIFYVILKYIYHFIIHILS